MSERFSDCRYLRAFSLDDCDRSMIADFLRAFVLIFKKNFMKLRKKYKIFILVDKIMVFLDCLP